MLGWHLIALSFVISAWAGNVVDMRVQFVEVYCERMHDLLRPSSRALDKGKGLPTQMGGRGLANASNLLVDSFDTFKR